jgi:hypothetical protein
MYPYGTRVFVRPVTPLVRVQRAEGMYGQFLPSGGQEVLWDSFLHKRLLEGAITVEPIEPVRVVPEADQTEKEPT